MSEDVSNYDVYLGQGALATYPAGSNVWGNGDGGYGVYDESRSQR